MPTDLEHAREEMHRLLRVIQRAAAERLLEELRVEMQTFRYDRRDRKLLPEEEALLVKCADASIQLRRAIA